MSILILSSFSILAVSRISRLGPLQLLSRCLILIRAAGYAVQDQVEPIRSRVKERWGEYVEKARREQ